MSGAGPTLDLERALLDGGCASVAGVDEVGRGALAGPVTVGVTVVDASTAPPPDGLRDSKLLRPAARERLAPQIGPWAVAAATAEASAAEIDDIGIVAALRTAALRALAELPVTPDAIVLDGHHDWLGDHVDARVHTQVKADMTCASVAAASVLAKVARDAVMATLARSDPALAAFGWDANKGYASAGHVDALRRYGPTDWHRRSWRLPGCGPEQLTLP